MIIEFASEVSNLAWRVSQSQNGGAIFARTKWSPMFGSVVFDYQWCILIVMSVKSSFYNEYDIKNNEKPVFWAQRGFQNHHQTFHDRCPEKIGPLPKKSDHWSTRTCPENIRPAPTWGPMTAHQSVAHVRHIKLAPAANLCILSAIVFLPIKAWIWRHIHRYLDGSAIFCWLSTDLYMPGPFDPDD